MLHGFGSSGADFGPLIPRLRSTLTVIAPDLPGWGYSERSPRSDHSHAAQAALLLDLLDRLGIGSAVVFGHGAGADIARSIARAAPERVIALVLSGAPGFDPAIPSWFRALLVPIVPLLVETWQGQRLIQRAVHVPGQRSNEQLVTTHLAEARVAGHAATFLAILTRTERDPKLVGRSADVPTLLISDRDPPEHMAAAIVSFVLRHHRVTTAHRAGNSSPGLIQRGVNRP
jgi:pimeloyl-ACP methyl ester carboxylesterase